jgi:hypothetical protein
MCSRKGPAGEKRAHWCASLHVRQEPKRHLVFSTVDLDNPLLTGLLISIDFLVVFLLDELVSVAV